MKYQNGKELFPAELLALIQDYVEGQYVYIPKRDESKEKWGSQTTYRRELDLRNSHIYTDFLKGFEIRILSERYSLSEKSIRRILLLKRKGAEKRMEQIKALLPRWRVSGDIRQIYNSAWAIGEDYILKVNTNPAGLKRNITIMRTLKECGIPVAQIIEPLDGGDYSEDNGNYYLLMNRLPGTHIINIYEEDCTPLAHKTGEIVAWLHQAFLQCEQKITFWNNCLLDEMKGWIERTLREHNFKYLSEADFNACINELSACYDNLPRQLIHRDFHYGNILFLNGELSGYIDFDLSQKNVRIFDLGYFLTGLLANYNMKKENVNKWYSVVSSFIKGYEKANPLSQLEKDSLPCYMKCIEVLFTAYYLSIEDDESARNAADLFSFTAKNEGAVRSAINSP